MLSSLPNALHIYDPLTGDDTPVSLTRTALALALSPNGKFAAVAQNALITYIDLANGRIIKTVTVATKPTSIALGPNNTAYVMSGDQAFPRILAVDFSTCLVKQNDKQRFTTCLDLEIHTAG